LLLVPPLSRTGRPPPPSRTGRPPSNDLRPAAPEGPLYPAPCRAPLPGRLSSVRRRDESSGCTGIPPSYRGPRRAPRKHRRDKAPRIRVGLCPKIFRRRPTLPGGNPPSTIGADRLNFRVRDGNGCDSVAMATGNLARLNDTFRCRSLERSIASTNFQKRSQALGRLVPVS
jgi:hypothetical protein